MNTPYGGELIDLKISYAEARPYITKARDLPRIALTMRQLCDFELLANGGFSPLTGFMDEQTYVSVRDDLRLPNGMVWPIPITLDVSQEIAENIHVGNEVILEDGEGVPLGVIKVSSIYTPDKDLESAKVFGTSDPIHPGVRYAKSVAGEVYIGGVVRAFSLPHHYDFIEHRLTPKETRDRFEKMGWSKIVAFQTRNPMHRAHVELTLRACEELAASILIHPVVGMTKPGDVDHYTRVRTYKAIIDKFPSSTAELALLPLAMRMGGPREAVWHAIIRKNFGCTHFIVGRDHAGPGKGSDGEDLYGPYEAQELAEKYAEEIGIDIVPFKMMVYAVKKEQYVSIDELGKTEKSYSLSGTELREMLNKGKDLPGWFTYPEVAKILKQTYRPLRQRGLVVFFTGLSGAGKSTLARGLFSRLHEVGGKTVTLLDGDEVRQHLSSELGFSKEHRDLNVTRIGYVASEIAKHGGIAICAPIAPYDVIRKKVRAMAQGDGGFILIHVSTPIEECEKRDRKGLYAAAKAGKIKNFTGVSDPYEIPEDADLVLNTVGATREELVQEIMLKLEQKGYI